MQSRRERKDTQRKKLFFAYLSELCGLCVYGKNTVIFNAKKDSSHQGYFFHGMEIPGR